MNLISRPGFVNTVSNILLYTAPYYKRNRLPHEYAELLSCPGYFREPHWLPIGLLEISRVTLVRKNMGLATVYGWQEKYVCNESSIFKISRNCNTDDNISRTFIVYVRFSHRQIILPQYHIEEDTFDLTSTSKLVKYRAYTYPNSSAVTTHAESLTIMQRKITPTAKPYHSRTPLWIIWSTIAKHLQ